MWFISWLRNGKCSGPDSRGRRHKVPRKHAGSQLALEALEGRWLPSTLTVTNVADNGTGSLRAEIAAARTGDTIVFAHDLQNRTITLTSGELSITNSLTIQGLGENHLTLNGNNLSRVFDIGNNATVTIDQLTIANGETVGDDGGGILNEAGATLNLDYVTLANNQALANNGGVDGGSGGGIENFGSLSVNESTFSNNVAALGSTPLGSNGGAIDSYGPSLTVNNSTFSNNQANSTSTGQSGGSGGAINITGSTATVTNCTFDDNSASGRLASGGAIDNEPSDAVLMTICNSTFIGNQAVASNGTNDLTEPAGGEALGGAVFGGSPLAITCSTFTDNLAKGGDQGDNSSDGVDGGGFVGIATGGGVCNFFSSLTVCNSTFTDNQAVGGNSAVGPGADAAGGGVLGAGFASNTLTNVVFIGNQAIGGSGAPGSPGGSGFGGGFYSGIYSTATVSNALFLDNQAVGGAGGKGAVGGAGAGGALANGGGFGDLVVAQISAGPDNSSLSLDQCALSLNVAQGGAGGAGGNGGNGLGGGCFVLGGTTASIDATLIEANAALGGFPGHGGVSGQGVGGGLYSGTGAGVTLSQSSAVLFNFASTSADDIFP
jgi:hypothetical protein